MACEEEQWRVIPGWEGAYEASNLGRIRSIDREVPCKDGRVKHLKGMVLKQKIDDKGYYRVNLSYKARRKGHLVHQLVLFAFVGPKPEGGETLHDDGNRLNNNLSNLKWGTNWDNHLDRFKHGRTGKGGKRPTQTGSLNKSAAFTEEQVLHIRTLRGKISAPQLGKQYGVNSSCIYKIWYRESWTHI